MTTRRTPARRTSPRRRSASRKLTWLGISASVNTLGNNARSITNVFDTRQASIFHMIGGTIIAIHGEFGARLTSSTNIANNARISSGLIMVQGDAMDAGTAGVPDPDLDADASWLHHMDLIMQGDATTDLGQARIKEIHNRSQRKIRANEALVWSVTNQANVSADVHLLIRYLVKLP